MLTLQFMPYSEIELLGSARRVKKLLDLVKEDKIVLLEGRLKKEEETDLIQITMEEIDEKFKGVELAVINPEIKGGPFFNTIKRSFVNMLLGNRTGFTIIGPATIVKEIKKDPDKIQLYTREKNNKNHKSNGKKNKDNKKR